MGTFLEELRAVAEHVREHSTKVLDVPGAGGRLAVRFRPPPDREALTGLIAAYKMNGALSSDQERQLIIDCCDEILHRNGTGELSPVEPDGGPLRFDAGDERWGDDIKTARECVAKLYNLDKQPLAAAGHADVLVDWLQGIDADVAARVQDAARVQEPGKDDASAPS